jgi:hypothetical protein
MGIVVKILEKDESMNGDTLTLGLPDENGTQIIIATCVDDDLDALKKGSQYTLAFVPFVAPSDPAAVEVPTSSEPMDVTSLVPVDHPVVIDPQSANDAAPAAVPAATTAASVPDVADSTGPVGLANQSQGGTANV